MRKFTRARATAAVGGAFAAALLVSACGGSNDSPDGAVENFLDNGMEDLVSAIGDGDYQGAVDIAEDYLCAEEADSLREMADQFEGLSDEERAQAEEMMSGEDIIPDDWSYEIGEVNEDGDTATVEVEMTEGDEEPSTQSIDVVKEDDEWKVCSLGI